MWTKRNHQVRLHVEYEVLHYIASVGLEEVVGNQLQSVC